MDDLKAIYYGFWAQIAPWPVEARAAVVVAIVLLVVWPFIRLILPKAWSILCLAAVGITGGVYWIKRTLFYEPLRKHNDSWTSRYNSYTEHAQKKAVALKNRSEALWKRSFQFCPGQMIFSYVLILALIALPGLLSSKLSPQYLDLFSPVYRLYCIAEQGALQKAAAYEPLFIEDGLMPNQSAEPTAEAEPQPTAQQQLRLTERGRRRGANVRSGPGEEYSVVGGISGDSTVLLLSDEGGDWLHILLDDGTECWVHETLVELVE